MTLATLESREFLARFINDEKLKPVLFSDNWDPDAQSWIPPNSSILDQIKEVFGLEGPDLRGTDLAPGEPTDWDVYERFTEDVLVVSSDAKTGLVTVAIDWEEPTLAARWANLLVERINTELRHQSVERERKSIEYLRQQIDQTSLADLRAVLFRLVEEHTKNMTLAKVTEEYVFEVIDPAIPPQEKSKPRRSLIAAVGLAGGLTLGLLAAFLRAGLRKSDPDAP
jgi:uncharacterized protein involved in exopolysaccharide biosynthesis